jgi:hypothetical protein
MSIRSRKVKHVQNYDTKKLFVHNNLQYIPKEGLIMDAPASDIFLRNLFAVILMFAPCSNSIKALFLLFQLMHTIIKS